MTPIVTYGRPEAHRSATNMKVEAKANLAKRSRTYTIRPCFASCIKLVIRVYGCGCQLAAPLTLLNQTLATRTTSFHPSLSSSFRCPFSAHSIQKARSPLIIVPSKYIQ